MKRYPVSKGKDRKVFSKTAQNVHSVNFMFLAPSRGGRRL